MLISVLMSTYKEPVEYIRKSVDSILNQTLKDFEYIIMVDNPENEEMIALLREYQRKDDRIQIFINPKNLGLVSSLNEGLKHCTGQYIARMDADDISVENRFEKQLERIEQAGLDLVSCFNLPLINDEYGSMAQLPVDYKQCLHTLRYYACLPHPSWFGKREVFSACGGYRDIYACEDYDFLVRAALSGFKLGNCRDILLIYRQNVDGISRTVGTQQTLTASLIAQHFRKGRILPMEEYRQYLTSPRYLKAQKRLVKYHDLMNQQIICKDPVKKRILFLITRVSGPYWESKVKYLMAKYGL